MRRSDLMKLYTVETKTDPATGKDKRVAKYIGKYYHVDGQRRKALTRFLWPLWCAALAFFALGGFLPAAAARGAYVVVCYMACLLPLFYLLQGAVRVTRMGETINEIDVREGVRYVQHGSLGLAILGGLWVMADAVFLIVNGFPQKAAPDIAFLLCGALTAAIGLWMKRRADGLKPVLMDDDDDAPEAQPSGNMKTAD